MSDHWFDQLAAPRTRRQGFKLALAGAIGTLPLLRSQTAPAAVPKCVTPCRYVEQIKSVERYTACNRQIDSNGLRSFTRLFTPAGILFPHFILKDYADAVRCNELAAARHKAAIYDCISDPSCGGFDAGKSKDILCPGCAEAGGKCCPSPTNGGLSGYLCCPCCADNGDGCKACG